MAVIDWREWNIQIICLKETDFHSIVRIFGSCDFPPILQYTVDMLSVCSVLSLSIKVSPASGTRKCRWIVAIFGSTTQPRKKKAEHSPRGILCIIIAIHF
jgi:hypothetical protein